MRDYQRAVEEIRFVMQSEVWELTDDLQEAARTYAAACREVNTRLRRCDEYLKQGLRSEAIQLAEAEPNLLESVALLDIPERADWDEAAGLYELPVCEPLRLDIAQELNEAYIVEQPLQKWLARHRLLALARAPLAQRLLVLRKLADLDPDSLFWEEDVREMEQARFRAMATEVREAAKHRDAAVLNSLAAEIEKGGWRQPIPQQLSENITKYSQRIDAAEARHGLEELIGELEAAFQALDLPEARALRDHWRTLLRRAKLPPGDELQERAEPILGWIADEDAREAADAGFERALTALEQALDRDVSQADLERASHDVLKFERSIPEPLASRYGNRIAALELQDRRTRSLQIGLVVGVLLLFAGILGVVVHRTTAASAAERIAKGVQELLDDGQLAEARKLLESHEDWRNWEHLVALNATLVKAETDEKSRVANLQSALARARDAGGYQDAFQALEEARRLALAADEKISVEDLVQDWRKRQQASLAKAEAEIRTRLDNYQEELLSLEGLVADDPPSEDVGVRLKTLRSSLIELTRDAEGLRTELIRQVELLASRRDRAEVQYQQQLALLAARERLTRESWITAEVNDSEQAVAEYAEALTAYADHLENESRTERFKEVVQERAFWEGAVEWARISRDWERIWPADSTGIRERADECEAFLASHPAAPAANDAVVYAAALRAMLNRDEDPNSDAPQSSRARLVRYFSLPLLSEAWALSLKDARTFYLPESQDFTNKKDIDLLRIEYFIGYDRRDVDGRGDLKASELTSRKTVVAPHVPITQSVVEGLEGVGHDEWNSYFLALAERIIEAESLDEYVRFDLLKRTLETAADGNIFLEESLGEHLTMLRTDRVDPAARWMDPDDRNAQAARREAAAVLKRLPELTPAWNNAIALQEKLTASVSAAPEMIGWLNRVEGKWTCCTKWETDDACELRIAFGDDSSGRSEWRKVGTADSEGFRIRTGGDSFLHEGRPVFAFHTTSSDGPVSTQ